MNQSNTQSNSSTSYLNATGKIDYGLTNDFMFRAILQNNHNVLKGLICSLLHLRPEDITHITIKNPINLGENIEDKEFILDIEVMINHKALINLEMQVTNKLNWPERSLSYLCRLYDQLHSGQDYKEALPVMHICFLDFSLFEDHQEFYGIYKLLNIKDHYLYSDKFALGVVDLTHIELATQEDKDFQIDHWARLFKATTWEEIKMIASDNQYLSEATQVLYEYNADKIIRQKCQAREENERYERMVNKIMQEQADALAEKDATISEQNVALAQKDAKIADQNATILAKDAELTAKDAELAEKDALIAQLLQEKDQK